MRPDQAFEPERPTPMRTSPIKAAALLATAGLSVAAFGTAHAGDSDSNPGLATTTTVAGAVAPTAAPTSGAGETTTSAVPVGTSAVPVGGETTVAGAPTAAPSALPPAATVQQFQALLVPMLGPTTDLTGEFASLGFTPPAGIPTPDGTEVDNFYVYYYPDAEDTSYSYYNAQVVFTTAVPAADVVTLYQTQMVAAGYVQTADSVENEEGRQVRFLTYDIPNSAYNSAEISVGIVDDDIDFVQLELSDWLDPTVIQAFSSWPTGLPLLDQATEIDSASLRVDSFGGDYEGSIDTNWKLPIALADLRPQFDAALPSSPYTIDPDYEASPNSVYLLGGEFTSMSIYMGEGYPEGTSYYNVSARFDLQL